MLASKSRLSYKRRSRTTTPPGARLIPERIRHSNDTDIRTTYLPGIRPFTLPERRNGPKEGSKRTANRRRIRRIRGSRCRRQETRSDVPAPTPVAVRAAADTPSDARSGGFSGRNVGPSAPWAGNGAEGPMEHEASRRQMSRKLLPSMERISAPSLAGSMGLAT